MLSWLDRSARGLVVVPLIVIGLAFTLLAEWLIRAGAWLADVEDE
jgi:hypothetical protein